MSFWEIQLQSSNLDVRSANDIIQYNVQSYLSTICIINQKHCVVHGAYVIQFPLQVGSNGILYFGSQTAPCCPSPFSGLHDLDYIVAPYWTNISISGSTGMISYEIHTPTSSPALLSAVDSFIHKKEDNKFAGTWMLVTEWRDVLQSGQSTSLVSA